MKPPMFWRLLNGLRAWCEQDERLLIPHWIDAFGPKQPAPPEKTVPFVPLNLRIVRGGHKERAA